VISAERLKNHITIEDVLLLHSLPVAIKAEQAVQYTVVKTNLPSFIKKSILDVFPVTHMAIL
jgi:hypothetical protein